MNIERLRDLRWCISVVLYELDSYGGERIIAGEHPLHKAVVELEKLCVKNVRVGSKQPNKLFYPLRMVWYSLLDVSRGRYLVRGDTQKRLELDETLPKDRKEKAKSLAVIMILILRSCDSMIDLIIKTDGNLPYIVGDSEQKIGINVK